MSGPIGAVTPNNDAYGGGGLFRSAPPTSGPTGALPGPNTSSLAAGVNPQSAPFYARPNEGTNIRIPYGRVTPLADPRATGLPDVAGPKASTPTSLMSPTDYRASMHGDALIKPYMSETDTLRPGRLAFILAKKSVTGTKNAPPAMLEVDNHGLRTDELSNATRDARDFAYAINSTIAPSLPGTQRLQKLCSFEYAQRYVDVACNVGHAPLVLEVSDGVINEASYEDDSNVNMLHADNLLKWFKESASYGGRLHSIVTSALARSGRFKDSTADPLSMSYALKNEGVDYSPNAGGIKATIDNMRTADAAFVNKFKNGELLDDLQTLIAKSTHKDPLVMSGLPSAKATLGSMDNMGMLIAEADSQGNTLSASPFARDDRPIRPIAYTAYAATTAGTDATVEDLNFAAKKRQYGIFTCDEGPFLRGHAAIGVDGLVAHGLLNSQRDPRNILSGVPSRICTAEGDIVSFSILEAHLSARGLFDWTPDGMCLSKFSNVPDDVLEDQRIDARDGVLYNVAIQGPAITTNWTGSPHLAVLPSDRAFIIIVADVITVDDDMMKAVLAGLTSKKLTLAAADPKKRKLGLMLAFLYGLTPENPGGTTTAIKPITNRHEFANARQEFMSTDVFAGSDAEYTTWRDGANAVANGTNGSKKNVLLHNYRLEVATSSQMSSHSRLRFETGGSQKQHEFSRMGLKLGTSISEYIVGGWCIGTVMDSAASRAAMPDGMSIGPRTAPNTAAINMYVDIEYWSGDKLYRRYANVTGESRGLIRARFETPEMKSGTPTETVDEPTRDRDKPSTMALSDDTGKLTLTAGSFAETVASKPTPANRNQPIRQAALNAEELAKRAEALYNTDPTGLSTERKAEIISEIADIKKATDAQVKIVTDAYDAYTTSGKTPPAWLDTANTNAKQDKAEVDAADADAPTKFA